MDQSGPQSVLRSLRGPLRAFGGAILSDADALDEDGWLAAEAIIEEALAGKPEGIKRQIRLFLRVVNLLPLLTTGRTLRALPPERRLEFLNRLQRSSVMPIRRGVWGVRTLIFMGYYNQDEVRRRIGYAADPGGWEARP